MKIEFKNIEEFQQELNLFLLQNTDYIAPATRISTSCLEHIVDKTKEKLNNSLMLSEALMGTCKFKRKNERGGTLGMIRHHVEQMYGKINLSNISIAVQEFYSTISHVKPQYHCKETDILITDDLKTDKK